MRLLLLCSVNLLFLWSGQCHQNSLLVDSPPPARLNTISFPAPWTKIGAHGSLAIMTTPYEFIMRKSDNAMGGELLLGLTEPYGPLSENFFAVSLDGEFRIHAVTKETWQQAEPVSARSQGRFLLINDASANSINYRGRSFSKTGASWCPTAAALPSPRGTWIAIFSYTSTDDAKPKDLFPFSGGNEPGAGQIFVDIYNASSGNNVLSGYSSFKGIAPSSLFAGAAWGSGRFFVMPLDNLSQSCFLGILPSD